MTVKEFKRLLKRKEKELRRTGENLFANIRTSQNELFALIDDFILKLGIDGNGQLKNTTKNVKTLKEIDIIARKFENRTKNGIIKWIIDKVKSLFGLNSRFFDKELSKDTSIEGNARRRVMQSLGYDEITGTIIQGGYLNALTGGANIATEVAIQVNRALALKMNLADFRREFKAYFTSTKESGLGLLERHYFTKSFDLFQRVDRAIQSEYAEKLGLKYAIYAHTLKDNSRNFCRQRLNLLYSSDEIKKWESISFQGKPKIGYNPFLDCGGINCRGSWSWMSNDLAEVFMKTMKLNSYHTV